MLDLGVWMALQNVVEKMHYRKRTELGSLCRTVEDAWKEFQPIKLTNVYRRWKMVLDLIIEDEGGDDLVESKRGKLYRAPSEEAEDLDSDENENEAQGDESTITADDIEAFEHSIGSEC